MGRKVFHSSIEGAQHGDKGGLQGFLTFAADIDAQGAQPSNFMLEKPDGNLMTAKETRVAMVPAPRMNLDGISAHCPFWVHTTAWTGSKTMAPFLSPEVREMSPEKIEEWAETYILKLLDLCAELEIYVVPMFWGTAFGWEVASGYPWGMFSGDDYDLVAEGLERFVTKTAKIRSRAANLGISLCHEIHPGTAAQCADDFLALVAACDNDPCLRVNADPSHCWEGEDWQTRFRKVGDYVDGCHVKNHVVIPGFPLRSMQADWKLRAMQFTDLPSGDINLVRFVELMIQIGYPDRYCELMSTDTAPLVTEAESAHRHLDATAEDAVRYTNDVLVFDVAEGSFEDGMGATD